MMLKIDDNNIRKSLIQQIQSYKDSKLYEEFTTPSGNARADIVLVNGRVHGYEIKSDFDNLLRLENQILEYDRTFEMNSVVVSERHLIKVEEMLPEHWGIILAKPLEEHDSIRLSFIKRAKLNPNIDFNTFMSMLDSNKLKTIINDLGYHEKLNLTKTEVWNTFKYTLIELCNNELSKKNKDILKRILREELKS